MMNAAGATGFRACGPQPIIPAMLLRTFRVISFGCKVNQAEGEGLAERLRAAGMEEAAAGAAACAAAGAAAPAASPAAADVVIINTCAVTGEAARQARQAVRHALRSGAAVAVTGCAAHPAAGDQALRAIAGVLLVEPDKDRAAERLIQRGARNAERGANSTPHSALPRARALLKIQDGCPAACTYCIVPKVRPQAWSLPPDEAAARIARLVSDGYREIVLCGIHLGLYGVRNAECGVLNEGAAAPAAGLLHLVDRLIALPGRWRLRLSSIEPMEVSDALLALMAANPERLCPHLHVPLQSGSGAVLARMGRPYAAAGFLALAERIRRTLPRPAITTDVLAGFPGETDADHRETLRVCREAAFSRIHVFPFSPRPGTAAAAMGPPVPPQVVRVRRREVAALGAELAARFRQALVGSAAEVAIERLLPDGSAEGTSERYVRVRVPAPLPPGAARREIVAVRVVRALADRLEGEAKYARERRNYLHPPCREA
ncbi:MAG: MiaB/RimO family radical SAM methylthiotransferase [Planctomycetes bacterium]|nr:MiaB/RimO family radical SAM methylthiotransferase [Planctomycetota bacterium]